jgi:hypothetical protein
MIQEQREPPQRQGGRLIGGGIRHGDESDAREPSVVYKCEERQERRRAVQIAKQRCQTSESEETEIK